jgi:muconate cycloisomerase
MKIKTLRIHHTAVPLKTTIKHASHQRETSENLIAQVELNDGTVGYGEGVPRHYVTGETVETAIEILASHDWARIVGSPSDYPELVDRLGTWEMPETASDPRGRAGNAAHCAIEMAILDAYGRRFGESIGRAIAIASASTEGVECLAKPRKVRYSSAIMSDSTLSECFSAFKTWLNHFKQVKIKVGVANQDDRRRIARFRRILGARFDIRLDANESWPASEVLDRVEPMKRYRLSAIEQPVSHAEVDSLADLRPRLGVPVMLDESVCGYPDALKAIRDRTADFLNVRLSKCGGFIASLRMMGLAFRSGLGVQLGCHPGETAILSAAGRHVASRIEGIRFVEGSYDRYVLSQNVTNQDITFGYGGWAPPIEGPGLGVDVNPRAIERMTLGTREISYD